MNASKKSISKFNCWAREAAYLRWMGHLPVNLKEGSLKLGEAHNFLTFLLDAHNKKFASSKEI
jgi:hypothetical protein